MRWILTSNVEQERKLYYGKWKEIRSQSREQEIELFTNLYRKDVISDIVRQVNSCIL